jgi:hypothetical protein
MRLRLASLLPGGCYPPATRRAPRPRGGESGRYSGAEVVDGRLLLLLGEGYSTASSDVSLAFGPASSKALSPSGCVGGCRYARRGKLLAGGHGERSTRCLDDDLGGPDKGARRSSACAPDTTANPSRKEGDAA